MSRFILGNKEYSYINFSDLKMSDLPKSKIYSHSKYMNIGAGFDIETTKIPDEKLSTMYVWQFALGELTVIGRTWEEFRKFLQMVSENYGLNNKCRLLCYIHNMTFEWSFIKNQLSWNYDSKHKQFEVFGTDERNIIKACTNTFIEFRDSAILTQMPLWKLAESFDTGLEKLKGDLDYRELRHSNTPLTNEELAYCINDVQILSRFFETYIRPFYLAKHIEIPLTCTGIPRGEMKRKFKAMPKAKREAMRRNILYCQPSEEDYCKMIKWLLRGGYVHSNVALTRTFFMGCDMRGGDKKSSYPASALQNNFPWKFTNESPEWFYKYGTDKRKLKTWAFWGKFTFTNLRSKTPHSLESSNKIITEESKLDTAIWDNGRLRYGEVVTVYLGEQDFLNYCDLYRWDKVECNELQISRKGPLPQYVKDCFLEFFYLKETLEKDSINYRVSKSKLNALYGLMIQKLIAVCQSFNPDTGMMDPSDEQRSYHELIKNAILLPQWGCWVAMYSRRAIVKFLTADKLAYDDLYNDTDSLYVRNWEANKRYFEFENDRLRRINRTMYTGSYPKEIFKDLGCIMDDSGKIFKYKTLGCKRYMYSSFKNGKLIDKVTVAGMKKGSLQKFCADEGLDIYEEFDDQLELSTEYSQKLTNSYNDVGFTRHLTDKYGNEMIVEEKSCVTLYEIPFKMSMSIDYLELIMMFKNDAQTVIGGRRI